MTDSIDNHLALFCDFENIALGVRDARYAKFDINRILERLLVKGSIIVKKAYCDWGRYKDFKSVMHEANFELIDIPHVRQSGKNSADIRMVVDALDLCYTKSHVNTFVVISGDSDFSPLVSKLRENAKTVIGSGREELHVGPADQHLRRVHLLRRPHSRAKEAKTVERADSPQETGQIVGSHAGGNRPHPGDRGRPQRGAGATRRSCGAPWSSRR